MPKDIIEQALPACFWVLGNIIFALIGPLLMVGLAQKIATQARAIRGNVLRIVFGDGFLFFYGLLLVIGLGYDSIKDQTIGIHKLTGGLAATVFMVSSVFVPANLVAYLLALKNRLDRPNEGKDIALWSLLFGACALLLVLAVRTRANLW